MSEVKDHGLPEGYIYNLQTVLAVMYVFPTLPANHCSKPRLPNANRQDGQRQYYYNTSCVIHQWENFIVQLVTVLQYQKGRSGCWCLPAILALSANRTWTHWQRILFETGAQRYANTWWQVGRRVSLFRAFWLDTHFLVQRLPQNI